jgi:outer membrane immunogenic protein
MNSFIMNGPLGHDFHLEERLIFHRGARMKKVIVAAALAVLTTTTSALAADLLAKKAPPSPTPIWSWSGCYVGANGGYGWNNGGTHYDDPNTTGDPINGLGPTTIPPPSGTGGRGGLGGVGAACNIQAQQWIYGIEGDIDGGHISGSQTTNGPPGLNAFQVSSGGTGFGAEAAQANEQVSLNWLSTIRARAGFAVTDRLAVFATGGLAIGGIHDSGAATLSAGAEHLIWSGSDTTAKVGVAAGGEAEWALSDRWTVKAEYLWFDLGNVSHPLNCSSATSTGGCANSALVYPTLGSAVSSVHGSIVRLGINYKFN